MQNGSRGLAATAAVKPCWFTADDLRHKFPALFSDHIFHDREPRSQPAPAHKSKTCLCIKRPKKKSGLRDLIISVTPDGTRLSSRGSDSKGRSVPPPKFYPFRDVRSIETDAIVAHSVSVDGGNWKLHLTTKTAADFRVWVGQLKELRCATNATRALGACHTRPYQQLRVFIWSATATARLWGSRG